ncbi:MAG: aspartate kinase [Planctomycetes bacterium]|nr:aspartate kinase [Planctomycetota bacterium]
MIVLKFGGTSLGNPERFRTAASIVKSRAGSKIVVASAVGGVTDLLIDCAQKAVKGESYSATLGEIEKRHALIASELALNEESFESLFADLKGVYKAIKSLRVLGPQILDKVSSYGERISTRLFAEFLTKSGEPAKGYDAYDVGMVTTADFGNARPLPESRELMKKALTGLSHTAVVTGFIGKTQAGDVTTLGRGGSDYSAALVGRAVEASVIEIWTDVSGVMTTDPRVVPEARTVSELSFAEASEIAFFGAKVLHPKTILPAVETGIPVKVLNTLDPANPGTTIVDKTDAPVKPVKAISFKKEIAMINIVSTRMLAAHGFLKKIFDVFAEAEIVLDMLATTEVSVSLTTTDSVSHKVLDELRSFATVAMEKKAAVSVVGDGIKLENTVSGRIFSNLGRNGIKTHMITKGASNTNVSFIVDQDKCIDAVKTLHKEFFG